MVGLWLSAMGRAQAGRDGVSRRQVLCAVGVWSVGTGSIRQVDNRIKVSVA